MFYTFRQRLILITYIIIVISIPVGTYLISQYQSTKTKANQPKQVSQPVTSITSQKSEDSSSSSLNSALNDLLGASEKDLDDKNSPTIATSYGPTLSFKISVEGRTKDNQAGKVFVGIMAGDLVVNPKFLLSFLVDVPLSGEYSNLSLAGLDSGSKYTALLKGSAQIATSSAFILGPAETKLNQGNPLTLLSGDLNEDNIINSADYSIVQGLINLTPASPNWNANSDLNKDNIINSFDISIIAKNLGKTGASGVWISPIPEASASSSLKGSSAVGGIDQLPVGSSLDGSTQGHWLWVPN